jgi:hypothetical protein
VNKSLLTNIILWAVGLIWFIVTRDFLVLLISLVPAIAGLGVWNREQVFCGRHYSDYNVLFYSNVALTIVICSIVFADKENKFYLFLLLCIWGINIVLFIKSRWKTWDLKMNLRRLGAVGLVLMAIVTWAGLFVGDARTIGKNLLAPFYPLLEAGGWMEHLHYAEYLVGVVPSVFIYFAWRLLIGKRILS